MGKYTIGYFLKHYSDFKGRATRPEYRRGFLFFILALIPTTLLFLAAAFNIAYSNQSPDSYKLFFAAFILHALWGTVVLVPFLAVSLRRAHDIGATWKILFGKQEGLRLFTGLSQKGENEYGPEPSDTPDAEIKSTIIKK